jgi:hypothetical protein
MKNLSRIFAICIAMAFCANGFSQSFGIKAGLNLSNVLIEDADDTYSDDFNMKPGFHVGPTVEFPLSDLVSFETGLLLSTKGYKYEESADMMGASVNYEQSLNLLYLDIPLTAKAKFDMGGVALYGAAGPYVGIGLTGKSKFEMSGGGESESEDTDVEWGSDENEDDLKRLDFGLTVGAGVEVNSFLIGVNYGLGLANISPATENDFKINNRVLALSLGYKF